MDIKSTLQGITTVVDKTPKGLFAVFWCNQGGGSSMTLNLDGKITRRTTNTRSMRTNFLGVRKRVVSKRVVLADVPRHQKPERGPRVHSDVPRYQKPRNEATFGCSPVSKTGTKVHSDVPRHQKPEQRYIRQNHPFTKPPFCFLSNFCVLQGEMTANER